MRKTEIRRLDRREAALAKTVKQQLEEMASISFPDSPETVTILMEALFGLTLQDRLKAVDQWSDLTKRLKDKEDGQAI